MKSLGFGLAGAGSSAATIWALGQWLTRSRRPTLLLRLAAAMEAQNAKRIWFYGNQVYGEMIATGMLPPEVPAPLRGGEKATLESLPSVTSPPIKPPPESVIVNVPGQ